MKFLFAEREGSVIMGPAGTTVAEIQQTTQTKMTLSGRGLRYPGTQLQELNIQSNSMEMVLSAAVQCMTRILEETGTVCNGDSGVEQGGGRLKIVLPSPAATAVIGKGGESIKWIREQSGLHLHVDPHRIPPGTEITEQIVALSGPLSGMQQALPAIADIVERFIREPWFAIWASMSNCGTHYPGLALDHWSGGKGGKGKGKGKDDGKGHPFKGKGKFKGEEKGYGGFGGGYQGEGKGFGGDGRMAEERFAAKRVASSGQVASKFLVSPKEASCIIGPQGSRIAEIQKSTTTKLTISGRQQFYPGTQLQEVNVQGNSTQNVIDSLAMCLDKILGDTGAVTAGEVEVEPGGARLKFLMPAYAVESFLGPNGEGIQNLQEETAVHIDLEQPGTTDVYDVSEQVVSMSGPLPGIQTALRTVIGHIGSMVTEPWFPVWATHSHCCAGGVATKDFRPWDAVDSTSYGMDSETMTVLSERSL